MQSRITTFGVLGLWFEQGGEPNPLPPPHPTEQRERRPHDIRDVGLAHRRLEQLPQGNTRQGLQRASEPARRSPSTPADPARRTRRCEDVPILHRPASHNQAWAPLPRSSKLPPGVQAATPSIWVMKQLQPPWAAGSRLVRRVTTVPQSICRKSTFRPSLTDRARPASFGCTQANRSAPASRLFLRRNRIPAPVASPGRRRAVRTGHRARHGRN